MAIIIEVDHRERDVGIIEVLRAHEDIVVEETCLSIGDYLINKH